MITRCTTILGGTHHLITLQALDLQGNMYFPRLPGLLNAADS
jgi:hypothetical protein